MTASKNVLFVASIEIHLEHFHLPYIRHLQSQGYNVHTAAFGENMIDTVDRHYNICFARSPFGLRNIAAYRALKSIIKKNDYKLIHCHTPVASMLTRLAARKARRGGTVVLYTAHGFHFFDGNNAIKNFLFKKIELFASKYTDCIITINKEDFAAIKRYGFKVRHTFLTHGIGIDSTRFKAIDADEKLARRRSMGFDAKDYIIIYPAEYCKGKNHAVLLKSIAIAKQKQDHIVLFLPGKGASWDHLNKLAEELSIRENIRITGLRSDVDFLMSIADLSAAPSRREGLPTHIIEAMATGLPCAASRIRGHVDLIEDGVNGFLFDADDPEKMAEIIMRLHGDPQLALTMRENNLKKARQYFIENTSREMADIYKLLLNGEQNEQ